MDYGNHNMHTRLSINHDHDDYTLIAQAEAFKPESAEIEIEGGRLKLIQRKGCLLY